MGLTRNKKNKIDLTNYDKLIALAGNPNVGKSTLFNLLTNMKQHTGNWTGKTVALEYGKKIYNNKKYIFVDLPGTYSLIANSKEEEIARNFICFEKPNLTLIIIDACSIERNLNLVIQTRLIKKNTIVVINMLDEAIKKGIKIDFNSLEKELKTKVIGISAKNKTGINELLKEIENFKDNNEYFNIDYGNIITNCLNKINEKISFLENIDINKNWISLNILDYKKDLIDNLSNYLNYNINDLDITEELNILKQNNINKEDLKEIIISKNMEISNKIYHKCVKIENKDYNKKQLKIDKIITSKKYGIPIMILSLGIILWITIIGANYPSDLLGKLLFYIQDKLFILFEAIKIPNVITEFLLNGIYKTLAWVVSVMLPPMAIFFPLFSLMEDLGYLPRIAFNLDKVFKKCGAHGKQSLTMCMGFGCNACGVIGCRIIESKKERLIATLTNNLVPCNGRFPSLIAIITIFLTGYISNTFVKSIASAFMLLLVIIFSVALTLLLSLILSKTLLKGEQSSFTLELPPYRKPKILKTIKDSIFDRTLFVLSRAVIVAIPSGAIIWLLANINIGNTSILLHIANFLKPLGNLMGLDGIILMAFILGFPANEIVIPIMLMAYLATGTMTDYNSLKELQTLLINNGWTIITAISFIIFTILHFPCGTTLLTIKKETKSIKWAILSFIIPTIMGIITCIIVANLLRLII